MEIGNEKILYVNRSVLQGETVLLVRDHNTELQDYITTLWGIHIWWNSKGTKLSLSADDNPNDGQFNWIKKINTKK